MSFTDDLKRSLGFEETESGSAQKNGPSVMDSIRDIIKPKEDFNRPQAPPQQQYRPTPKTQPNPTVPNSRPTPVYDDFDDVVIKHTNNLLSLFGIKQNFDSYSLMPKLNNFNNLLKEIQELI